MGLQIMLRVLKVVGVQFYSGRQRWTNGLHQMNYYKQAVQLNTSLMYITAYGRQFDERTKCSINCFDSISAIRV